MMRKHVHFSRFLLAYLLVKFGEHGDELEFDLKIAVCERKRKKGCGSFIYIQGRNSC